jgi:hypothetical protein
MSSRPTTPKQSPRTLSRVTTPRIGSPRTEPGQIYSPSTPQDFRQRYETSALSSPVAIRSGTATPRTPQRQPSNLTNSRVAEEELELGQLPTLSRASSNHQHSSPFHDSKAWKRTPEFDGQGSPGDSIKMRANAGAQYARFPKASSEPMDGDLETDSYNGSPQKKQELLYALGYETQYETRFTPNDDSSVLSRQPPKTIIIISQDNEESEWKPPRPSLRLLFSLCTAKDFFLHILPCILFSMAGGAIPTVMTLLVGNAFGAFSAYPADVTQATADQRSVLMKSISHSCLILFCVGLAGWVVNTAMLTYWTRLGEVIANRLRAEVYRSVMARGMEWFDLGMGFKEGVSANHVKEEGEEAGVGAGGLMAKFTRSVSFKDLLC